MGPIRVRLGRRGFKGFSELKSLGFAICLALKTSGRLGSRKTLRV